MTHETKLPPVDMADLEQIIAWLEDAPVYEFELEAPGQHICIIMAGRTPTATESDETQGRGSEAIVAPSVGRFLTTHPDRDTSLVRVNDSVTAGDVLGLLKIGPLLTPVLAPSDGKITRVSAESEATVVDYGTRLFDIVPTAENSNPKR